MSILVTEEPAESTAPDTHPGAKWKASRGAILVERPGMEEGSWERWIVDPERTPKLLHEPLPRSAQLKRIVCLPSRSLYDWPLWIAGGGDPLTLARLELSGRHLIKRGMEQSLGLFAVGTEKDRQLLLAICPEEPFPEKDLPDDWKEAGSFDLPVRMVGDGRTDLLIWREWGRLYACFLVLGKPVLFCPVDEANLGGLLLRTSLRLQAEGVLQRSPKAILLAGIPSPVRDRIRGLLESEFHSASITHCEELPHPRLPSDPLDLPPFEAREQRTTAEKRKRFLSFAMVGAVLYVLLLLWGAGDLMILKVELARIRKAVAAVARPAAEARADSERWKALRSAVDPSFYALDLLAAIAAPTEGGKVRLTRFTMEHGKLQVSGEATDVTQAYSFQEQLKKKPALQAYEWTAGQPQLAGKNSVRFDMEGSRSDAKTGTK